MDELCEFPRTHLEALRQPLEERRVTVVRARAAVTYPSEFMLVAAANPCPCGHLGDDEPCRCSPPQLQTYQSHLSGPIKDRIDLTVAVPRQKYADLFDACTEETSAAVRARVGAARARQHARQDVLNAVLNATEARAHCKLRATSRRLLARSGERLRLSARAYFRVLRVARTIADLADAEIVGDEALAEAIRYRSPADG